MLNSFSASADPRVRKCGTLRCGFGERNLSNARPIGSALFSSLLLSWFAVSCRFRTDDPVNRLHGATR